MVKPTSTPAVVIGTISSSNGGSVSTADGSFQITFPANAVSSSTTITFRDLVVPTQAIPRGLNVLRSFTLDARASNGQAITQFAQPFTIVITYTDAQLAALGISEANLNVMYWNGTSWMAMLPCAGCGIDLVNNRITIIANHFTEFALTGGVPTMNLPVIER
jgi:hypothetical protein